MGNVNNLIATCKTLHQEYYADDTFQRPCLVYFQQSDRLCSSISWVSYLCPLFLRRLEAIWWQCALYVWESTVPWETLILKRLIHTRDFCLWAYSRQPIYLGEYITSVPPKKWKRISINYIQHRMLMVPTIFCFPKRILIKCWKNSKVRTFKE